MAFQRPSIIDADDEDDTGKHRSKHLEGMQTLTLFIMLASESLKLKVKPIFLSNKVSTAKKRLMKADMVHVFSR